MRRREDVLTLALNGYQNSEIAKLLGVSAQSVWHTRQRAGIPASRRPKRTREEYLVAAASRQREYRARNPHLHARRHGVPPEEYASLLKAQGGVCAICREPEHATQYGKVRSLCVDHDHDTGRIRGLLCRDCNVALGKFRDSPSNLKRAVAYLEAADHHG